MRRRARARVEVVERRAKLGLPRRVGRRRIRVYVREKGAVAQQDAREDVAVLELLVELGQRRAGERVAHAQRGDGRGRGVVLEPPQHEQLALAVEERAVRAAGGHLLDNLRRGGLHAGDGAEGLRGDPVEHEDLEELKEHLEPRLRVADPVVAPDGGALLARRVGPDQLRVLVERQEDVGFDRGEQRAVRAQKGEDRVEAEDAVAQRRPLVLPVLRRVGQRHALARDEVDQVEERRALVLREDARKVGVARAAAAAAAAALAVLAVVLGEGRQRHQRRRDVRQQDRRAALRWPRRPGCRRRSAPAGGRPSERPPTRARAAPWRRGPPGSAAASRAARASAACPPWRGSARRTGRRSPSR